MAQKYDSPTEMAPIDEAPALIRASIAHRWLPISRAAVYEAIRRGKIEVRRLPSEMFITCAELRRIRGEEEPQPQPAQPVDRPRRYQWARSRRSAVR